MAAEPEAIVTPTRGEALSLEIVAFLFVIPVCVLGYLAFFLSRTCVYEEPYTLQGCVVDLLWSHKSGVVKCLLGALLVYGVPMHFHFKRVVSLWRSGDRSIKGHFTSGAVVMLVFGLLTWVYWPLVDLARYWMGTDLRELIHKKGDFIPLFDQAVTNMATQPVVYAIAGFLGGGLHYLGLRFCEKQARKNARQA